MKKFVFAFVAVAVVTAAPTAASADEAEARAAFRAGRKHFKAGEYKKAAVLLQRAYDLKPHPALLRYLGQTYYKMNKARKAINAFKRYLKEAPQAPDRAKIIAKVRELEMVVGAGDDDDDASATPPPPPPPPDDAADKPDPKINLAPTGEDTEVPDALQKPIGGGTKVVASKREKDQQAPDRTDAGSGSALGWLKWVAAGVAVGGLGAGVAFNVIAAGKASDLEAAVKAQNPEMNKPVVSYNKTHHDLQEGYKSAQTIAIISYIAAGVGAGLAVTFFMLDKPSAAERSAASDGSFSLAPVIGGGNYGIAGRITF